jgi:hypothetical protein
MTPITLPNLQPNERAFLTGSGRRIKVAMMRAKPMHDHEYRIATQAFEVDAEGGVQLDAQGKAIASEIVQRGVDFTGVAAGTHSLKPVFWKRWDTNNKAQSASNITIPASLKVGDLVDLGEGRKMRGGRGKPREQDGALGEFYADLESGLTYRKRPGELEHIAQLHAEQFDLYLTARAEAEASPLPDMPEPPPPAAVPLPVLAPPPAPPNEERDHAETEDHQPG